MKLFSYQRFLLTFIGITLLGLISTTLMGQCLLDPLSLNTRIDQAGVIVEGRVITRNSYWKADSSGILTSQVISIYKVLKGTTEAREVELITPGGSVGNEMDIVTPSLHLEQGEVGIFFLEGSINYKKRPFQARKRPVFSPLASVQGFIRYDEYNGNAQDVFTVYSNIERELYEPIRRLTRQSPVEIETYRLVKQEQLGLRSNPAVNSFFPQTISAGTQSVLTIRGVNFGTLGANSAVLFPNPDNGGNSLIEALSFNLVSWSNNEIKIRVPTSAGTGKFIVRSHSGEQANSGTILTIPYAQYSVNYEGDNYSVQLVDGNSEGGITLKYGISTLNNGIDFRTQAQAPFDRALSAWQCKTGFNVKVSGTTNENESSGRVAPNIVMFDNDSDKLPLGVLGRTYSSFSSCFGDAWYLKGFDIVFNRNISWNYSPGQPCQVCIDFESVSLHELGHGHLLGHVIDNSQVMHYAIASGATKRDLDEESTVAGGREIIASSHEVDVCIGLIPGMEPDLSDCEAGNPYFVAKLLLEGYMIPGEGRMHTYLKDTDLLPGQQPFNVAPYFYGGSESVSSFPDHTADWVLVELREAQNIQSIAGRKAVLLKNDGTLMDINGNKLINMDGVDVGAYYLVVYHPRHLGVVSSSTINYSGNPQPFDFTTSISQASGNHQLKLIDGKYVLHGGDFDGDGVIDERDFHKWRRLNTLSNQYISIDGDGSGSVNVHDVNIWARNKDKSGHNVVQNP